jgi:hypothetical protein
MKPEHLLLLQAIAKIESYSLSQLEQMCYISGKLDNLPNEGIEFLIRRQKDDAFDYEQKLLLKLITIFQTLFGAQHPDLSVFTPDELLKLLSGQNPT